MSKNKDRRKRKIEIKKQRESQKKLHFSLINYLLVIVGFIAVGLGFYFLNKGSITLAPILMILGYIVFIPMGLLWKKKRK